MLQRIDIRDRYSLQGDGVTDCLKVCCCGCCDLMQQEKESERLLGSGGPVSEQPAVKMESMGYPQGQGAPQNA
jgi:hypothetical protein